LVGNSNFASGSERFLGEGNELLVRQNGKVDSSDFFSEFELENGGHLHGFEKVDIFSLGD
jgi:hypothetical protein